MSENHSRYYRGFVVRNFFKNGGYLTTTSIPIFFTESQDATKTELNESLLRKYRECQAFYTPRRFTDYRFKTGLGDEIIPKDISEVTDSKTLAILEHRL